MTSGLALTCATPALAQTAASLDSSAHEIMLTAMLIGIIGVAVFSTIGMMRARIRAEEIIRKLSGETTDLRAGLDRAETLLDAEDQVMLAWLRPDDPPALTGSLSDAAGAPRARAGFLAFGAWLTPGSAAELDRRIEALRTRGTQFTLELATVSHTFIEACGRPGGGRPFVRFRDLTEERVAFARARENAQSLADELNTLRQLIDFMPMPAWTRDPRGRLSTVNPAYARAVDAPTPEQALAQALELLDRSGHEALETRRIAGLAAAEGVAVVVAGQRRVFDVVEVRTPHGSAGLATDMSDLERIQAELRRTVEFHARTLDQLATAVAIFGADKRLQFYNAAYRSLWNLDTAFLEGHPDDSAILDELRARRRLPDQADWRGWKREMLAGYTALEAAEHWLHLPDGQTLRVIANPHPQGGVTYVYENVTEKLELEKQNNALVGVQRETLDHLSEAVAVFGSDGRLRLWNPSLTAMWRLDDETLGSRPHIAQMIRSCERLHPDSKVWEELKITVTGLADNRTRMQARLDRPDGSVLELATVPLPDGATLVTFVNITDTVNVERALVDKNEALEEADRIKTDFVGLVSYELRSPLTNVIGFAHLLADPRTGPMTERQQEYFGHILASGQALMAIVDDILDLATIDAGTMEMQVEDLDIATVVTEAIEGVQDRVASTDVSVRTNVQAGIGPLRADGRRIRQVLFNLLSNALRFSEKGGTIDISAAKDGPDLVLKVADNGVGIPPEQVRSVFDRFYARAQGAQRGGAGLGLSLVKSFVELHGGSVVLDSEEGRGTCVTCRLPLVPPGGGGRPGLRDAAE